LVQNKNFRNASRKIKIFLEAFKSLNTMVIERYPYLFEEEKEEKEEKEEEEEEEEEEEGEEW